MLHILSFFFLFYPLLCILNPRAYSVQTLLSSKILSKNLKIKIYKTIILPVVLYGCETWSLTLREDNMRMDLEEIGISAGNWVDSAQDRNYWRALVSAALNLLV